MIKIDLENDTQAEIEMAFSNHKLHESITAQIQSALDNELHNVSQYIVPLLQDFNLDYDEYSIREILGSVLIATGNTNAGNRMEKVNGKYIKCKHPNNYRGARYINIKDIFKALIKDRYISSIIKDEQVKSDFVIGLIGDFDSILFDITKVSERLEDGSFITVTYIISEFELREDAALVAKYNRFRLPLIEKPIEWTTTVSGGYHTSTDKCALNKGIGNQPQQILDVLNKLQNQGFTHKGNIQGEFEYNIKKMSDGNWKNDSVELKIAEDKARATMLTAEESYYAIGNREIYFECKYDFRGRVYFVGYDIAVQGNAPKKGALRPTLVNK